MKPRTFIKKKYRLKIQRPRNGDSLIGRGAGFSDVRDGLYRITSVVGAAVSASGK